MPDNHGTHMKDQHVYFKNLIIDIANLLCEKKARDILVYDMQAITNLYDFSVIATSESGLHQRALISFLEYKLKQLNIAHSISFRTDPKDSWVVIDISFALIHLFSEEARSFYNLEELWNQAPVVYTQESTDNREEKAQLDPVTEESKLNG